MCLLILHSLQSSMETGFGVSFLTLAACGRKRNMAQLQGFFFPLRPVSSMTVFVYSENLQPFLMVFIWMSGLPEYKYPLGEGRSASALDWALPYAVQQKQGMLPHGAILPGPYLHKDMVNHIHIPYSDHSASFLLKTYPPSSLQKYRSDCFSSDYKPPTTWEPHSCVGSLMCSMWPLWQAG